MHDNLTPIQRQAPKEIVKEAFERLPETCDLVRAILNEAQTDIMTEYEIQAGYEVRLDQILSYAFCRIRNEVTQRFRDEQVTLLQRNTK